MTVLVKLPRRLLFVAPILVLLIILPLAQVQAQAPVVIREEDAVIPYLEATMDIFIPSTSAKILSGFHTLTTGDFIVIPRVKLELGIIPSGDKAIALFRISQFYSKDGVIIRSTNVEEFKTDAKKEYSKGILAELHPVSTLAEFQANATWYTLSSPVESDGEYYILYFKASSRITVTEVKIDPDTNHSNGNEIVLWNKPATVEENEEFWLPLPYTTIAAIYVVTKGSYIPVTKLYYNELSVRDHRFLEEQNLTVNDTESEIISEETTEEAKTENIWIGVDSLHDYIMEALKNTFGEVETYNLTSFNIELKVGKNIKYETAGIIKYSWTSLAILPDLSGCFRKVRVTVAGYLDTVRMYLSRTASELKKTATSTANLVVIGATNVARKASETYSRMAKMTTSTVQNLAESIKNAGLTVKSLAESTVNNVGKALANVKKTIVDAGAKLVHAVKAAPGAVLNFGKLAYGAVTGFIKKFKTYIVIGIIIAVIAVIALLSYGLTVTRRRF